MALKCLAMVVVLLLFDVKYVTLEYIYIGRGATAVYKQTDKTN